MLRRPRNLPRLRTFGPSPRTRATQIGFRSWSLRARVPFSACRCSRRASSSALLSFTARRFARSPTSRSICVKNFAAQAVIAIENTRLLSELRQRTDDLSEALEYQTATSEVLNVISRSPNELQPVLDAILRTAGRLCEADYACFFKLQDGKYHVAASNNAAAAYIKFLTEHPIAPDRTSCVGRAAVERRTVHIPDCLADPEYKLHEYQRVGNHRSLLGVPLLREGVPIAVIGLLRSVVKPFTPKQIELVTTFADQAMIAIENTRLFEAEQQRTRELSESLEQQTATSEVLKVISSSPGELEPVFRTMLEKATNLCAAQFGNMYLRRGDAFELAATHNTPPDFAEERTSTPYRFDRGKSPTNQMVRTKNVIHVADLKSHELYLSRDPRAVAAAELGGVRSCILVPMLNEGEVVGYFAIYRQEVRPFTDKQIELVKNFAAQAVIAIENTRLLNELRESLAAADRDLGGAQGHQLHPANWSRYSRPCWRMRRAFAKPRFGTLYLREGDAFRAVAATHVHRRHMSRRGRRDASNLDPAQDGPLGHAGDTKQVVHIADIHEASVLSSIDIQLLVDSV